LASTVKLSVWELVVVLVSVTLDLGVEVGATVGAWVGASIREEVSPLFKAWSKAPKASSVLVLVV